VTRFTDSKYAYICVCGSTPDAIVLTQNSYLDLRGRFAAERKEQGGEGRKEREVTAKNGREGNIGE